MSIPNAFMLSQQPTPEYFLPFTLLWEVVWAIWVAKGVQGRSAQEKLLELAFQNPKISGVVFDDFFDFTNKGWKEGQQADLSLQELRDFKPRLRKANKKLKLWAVLYEHELNRPLTEYLKLCDIVQLWTWYGQNLEQLRSNFEKAENLAQGTHMALGLYWWDLGNSKPLPLPLMRSACETALQLLLQRRIEAIIFCGNWLCDRG